MTSTFAPTVGATDEVDGDGVVEAIVAVTGVVDEVGDVIVPGAFARTLARLMPKGADAHDWKTPIARTLAIKELWPGDPALPQLTANGRQWPREAGGLWVRGLFNLATKAGRNAFENARFYGSEQSYSIGYKVVPGGAVKRGGVRYISDLNLYEWSPVLHGASRFAQQLDVKTGRPRDVEVKALALAPGRRRTPGAAAVLTAGDLAEAAELSASADVDLWAEVVARDVPYRLDAGAHLWPLPTPDGADAELWGAVPCAACGTWTAHVRGKLPDGSALVCPPCAGTRGMRGPD